VKLKSFKPVPVLICLGAIAIACLAQALLGHLWVFQRLEWMAYDWRLRVANDFHPPVSDKLAFVYIGDDAITLFDRGLLSANLRFGLKWPRHIYGRAIRELKAQGAREIGLDIFFDDRRIDRTLSSSDSRKLLYRLGKQCFRDQLLLRWAASAISSSLLGSAMLSAARSLFFAG
jgi:CHASE2 domain-containing sensor protein